MGKSVETSVQRKSLTEQVYEILEDQIIGGDITPGTKLSEESVADVFGVSRSPAREAIVELERVGLAIRIGPRDRIVRTPTRKLISETYEIWWILDSIRTYLSSLGATTADHKRQLEVLSLMEKANFSEDEEGYRTLSKEFHELLTNRNRNSQIEAILDDYNKHIRWFRALYYKRPDTSATAKFEHRRIVDCYIRQDLLGLIEVIRIHILRQRDAILARVKEEEPIDQND